MTESRAPIVMGITGASGAPYAVRVLQMMICAKQRVQLIVSSHGLRLLQTEMGIDSIDALRKSAGDEQMWDTYVRVFDNNDRGAPPASGSAPSSGMLVCPCSMGTLSAISVGASRSLIERAADVALKERRKLVLVPRETPLSAIHLQNMLRLSRAGAVVLPASPGFYGKPESIAELVDFVAARVLDQLSVPHSIGKRWDGESAK